MSPTPSKRRKARAPLAPVPVESVPNAVVSARWVLYLLSLFIPWSGMLVALFLYDQETHEARKVGRNCLLIGFVFWVVIPFLVMLLLLIVTGFALAGWISSLVPAE